MAEFNFGHRAELFPLRKILNQCERLTEFPRNEAKGVRSRIIYTC
jgi:hypothetical protein